MIGKLIVYHARASLGEPPEIREMAGAPLPFMLNVLQALVEDDIEQVPLFDSITIGGKREPCVALCGEHGKDKGLPVNRRATLIWRYCIREHASNPLAALAAQDVLVGTVVVLTGDREFMESL